MNRLLAIDTSTSYTSLALMEDHVVISQTVVRQNKSHSDHLMVLIKNILKHSGLEIQDIDFYSVGIGPGSFTGLRIGLATAKTLAQVFDKPIVGVNTLEAMSYFASDAHRVLSLIDARGERYYYAIFEKITSFQTSLEKEGMLHRDDILDKAFLNDVEVLIVDKNKEKISESVRDRTVITVEDYNIAVGIAHLARLKFSNKEHNDLFALHPHYILLSQAERDLLNKGVSTCMKSGQ